MPRTFYHEEITKVGLNPYEAVIASSREARRLNQGRVGAGLPEGTEKMATVALSRLVEGEIEMTRDGRKVEGDTPDAAAEGEETAAGR